VEATAAVASFGMAAPRATLPVAAPTAVVGLPALHPEATGPGAITAATEGALAPALAEAQTERARPLLVSAPALVGPSLPAALVVSPAVGTTGHTAGRRPTGHTAGVEAPYAPPRELLPYLLCGRSTPPPPTRLPPPARLSSPPRPRLRRPVSESPRPPSLRCVCTPWPLVLPASLTRRSAPFSPPLTSSTLPPVPILPSPPPIILSWLSPVSPSRARVVTVARGIVGGGGGISARLHILLLLTVCPGHPSATHGQGAPRCG
jgi:hypothetical protein